MTDRRTFLCEDFEISYEDTKKGWSMPYSHKKVLLSVISDSLLHAYYIKKVQNNAIDIKNSS